MRIGLTNIYSFRPHVEHLYYMAMLLKDAGHEVYFLTCDGGLDFCYSRAIKGTGKVKECTKCVAGGIRSYVRSGVTAINGEHGQYPAEVSPEVLDKIALSSSCTLSRTESELEWNDPHVVQTRLRLHKPVETVYRSARNWIEKCGLQGVICFNGRMELTRAVTYACEMGGVPFVTHERAWFGDGIQLIPNDNCLSLSALNEMAAAFSDKPLTRAQAQFAGKLAAERFLQRNTLEWRLYNQNPEAIAWPTSHAGQRVLVLPSSKNEFAGHPDWRLGWVDNTLALNDFMERFGIGPEQIVVRGHPNWAEKVGMVNGDRAVDLYRNWTKERGIHFIESEDKASTYDLIQQADIVVMNGGSSAVEAGVCGKQVICLSPSTYQEAGFVRTFTSREDLFGEDATESLDPEDVIRKTLRFLYLRARRFPQFVNYVRALKTTRYEYYAGADPELIVSLLTTGRLRADDASYAVGTSGEQPVIEALMRRDWDALVAFEEPGFELERVKVQRRPVFRWIDWVREKMPRGDRG